MNQQIKVRFAPSPTGPLHIGGARSALFNWLLARHSGGKFIVRIEDTDLERSSRESEENILNALKWLGMDWDEGVETGGENGPYRQTERLELYHKYAQQLLKSGQAYYCYCDEQELEEQREIFRAKGELPRYNGKCRQLTDEQKQQYEKEGRKPVLRFKVPENQIITINDLVRSEVNFESNGIGDFIILKSDGIPTYNFAVVIDDALMKITHVIRAEEHLSNTPRQVLLYEALGFAQPQFAHISLILGNDRSKMSKRHGATSIEQYQSKGYLPEALFNFLALLGWSPSTEQEILNKEELVEQFDLSRVAKNPAVFDLEKLNWLNGMYIRNTDLDRLTRLAIPFFVDAGYIQQQEIDDEKFAWLKMIVASLQARIEYLEQIIEQAEIYFELQPQPLNEEQVKIMSEEQVPQVLKCFRQKISQEEQLDCDNVKKILKSVIKELKLKGKQVYMPVRIALTGQSHGPELYDVLPVFGKQKVLDRIDGILVEG